MLQCKHYPMSRCDLQEKRRMKNLCRVSRLYISPIYLFLMLLCILTVNAYAASGSVTYSKYWMYDTGVHVISINMNDPDVQMTPIVARRGIGTSEGFGSLLSRTKPTAAITGTFFDTRSLHPTGDIVI